MGPTREAWLIAYTPRAAAHFACDESSGTRPS